MRGILLGIFLMITGICQAQVAQVVKKEQEVNGVIRRGQQLSVQLEPKTVEKYRKDYMSRKAGKVKEANGIQQNIDKNRQRREDLELNVQHNTKQQEISRQQVQDMEKSVEVVRAKLKDIK